MIKLLLISTINTTSEVECRYPDLGLGYLAGNLRNKFGSDINIRVIDRDFEKTFEVYKPDLVGIRAVSQNYSKAKRIAEIAYKKGVPVLMGGIHITALPHSLDANMTIGCLGEGEDTIVELARLFLDKGRFRAEDLINIRGLCFWFENKLCLTPPRPPIEELDVIPLPARDLIKIRPHTYMFTSRGCPYHCLFCASSAFWKKPRYFSADYVVNEIGELIQNYKVKFITFYDDMFISNIPRLKRIAEGLDKAGLLKKIKFSCSCSAPNITADVVQILKEMNVVSVAMGLESGSDNTLQYLKGKAFSIAKNRQSVEILKKNNIAVNAGFVIGSPEETVEDMMDTYRFIKETQLSFFDIYVLTPYPGTFIWKYALDKQLVREDMHWDNLNINFDVNNQKAIILSEKMNRAELVRVYKKFRRLRLWCSLKNIWWHPYLIDLPNISLNIMKEKVYQCFHAGNNE